MSDRGSIGRRLPPEPAPRASVREPQTKAGRALVEWASFAAPEQIDVWREHAVLIEDEARGGVSGPTIGDVERIAEGLELVYVPAQHRLHAAPREECNIDDSMLNRHVLERDLDKVDPNVQLCKHCVSPAEARIIRAGLRRL